MTPELVLHVIFFTRPAPHIVYPNLMGGLAETAGNVDAVVDGQEVFDEMIAAFEASSALVTHVVKSVRVHEEVIGEDRLSTEDLRAVRALQTSRRVGVAQMDAEQ